MSQLSPSDALRGRLDLALAPEPDDTYDPVDEPLPAERTCVDCDQPATEWRRERTGGSALVTMVHRLVDGVLYAPTGADHGDPRWKIDSDDGATWALHKLGTERRKLDEIEALYAEELAKITEWRRKERAKHERTATFFEQHLIAYGLRLRATDAPGRERASHSLPAGTIRMTRSTVLNIVDEAALIEWAEGSHPDLVHKTIGKQPVKDLLKKDKKLGLQACTDDGEVVPGIEIVRPINPSVTTT